MILYSEKAADEFTDKVIAQTALTVGAIVCVSYLASAFVISVGAAGSSLVLTYAEYGVASTLSQAAGMATVFGASYAINAGYDWLKDTTGFENYVTGQAYNQQTMPENKAMAEATDKLYGAITDGLSSGNDIKNGQVIGYQNTTINNSTISQNRVFIADNFGNVTPSGTIVSNITISANNSLPNSSVGATQIQVSQNNTQIRITQNTTFASSTSVTSNYGTQYNNSLGSNAATGIRTAFGGAFKNLGINFGIDLLRATANWALASQIKELSDAMANEEIIPLKP